MGRASVFPESISSIDTGRCRTIDKNTTHQTIRCFVPDAVNEEQDYVLERKFSKPPPEMVEAMRSRRQRCDACAAPPGTRMEFEDTAMPKVCSC